jgi:hypothetical protein
MRSQPVAARLPLLEQPHLTELARLLPELAGRVPPPEPLPDPELRRRLFGAIGRAVLAAGSPLLLIADDVQWADPQSLRLIHYMMRAAPSARLLVAATARREELDEGHPLAAFGVMTTRSAICLLDIPCATRTRTSASRVSGRRALPGGVAGDAASSTASTAAPSRRPARTSARIPRGLPAPIRPGGAVWARALICVGAEDLSRPGNRAAGKAAGYPLPSSRSRCCTAISPSRAGAATGAACVRSGRETSGPVPIPCAQRAGPVPDRVRDAQPPEAVHEPGPAPLPAACWPAHRASCELMDVLAGFQGDIVAEPLRLLMRVGMTPNVDQQCDVVERHPVPVIQPGMVSQPRRDQALAQDVFRWLAEAQIRGVPARAGSGS